MLFIFALPIIYSLNSRAVRLLLRNSIVTATGYVLCKKEIESTQLDNCLFIFQK